MADLVAAIRRRHGTAEALWNQEAPRSGAAGPRIEIKIDRIMQKHGGYFPKGGLISCSFFPVWAAFHLMGKKR